ncbi:hypothetical protein [uncultured Serinicoccus sp.]|uniref:hypothetical protein n=1 Tax=uncultured Serinicoccus sp. TaxID=735514 RepID=UPI00261F8C3C|nr:hypothetical protein [uncultured Serinicoccus sp.]
MGMRRYGPGAAVAAAVALMLSACGGEDPATDDTATAESSAEEAPAEEPTEDTTTEETAEETTEDTAAETTPADSEDSGEDVSVDTLPAGVTDAPPETVGEFTLADDSGPAVIYEMETGEYVTVDSNVLGSPYEDLVAEIETDNTEAGTGSCGLNSGGTSAVCYQQIEGGVITMTGDAAALDLLVTFADDFATAATS